MEHSIEEEDEPPFIVSEEEFEKRKSFFEQYRALCVEHGYIVAPVASSMISFHDANGIAKLDESAKRHLQRIWFETDSDLEE